MIGYVVKFNGSVISWKTKKQQVVALSTTEAKLYSLSATLQEVLWTKNFLESLGIKLERNLIYEDNRGTIELIKNGKRDGRTKHVEVKHHFIGDHVKDGNVEIKYLRTEMQLADFMTKALGKTKFEKFRDELGVVMINEKKKNNKEEFYSSSKGSVKINEMIEDAIEDSRKEDSRNMRKSIKASGFKERKKERRRKERSKN